MTVSGAIQSKESIAFLPSSYGSGQNNNQFNNSSPSLTNNIEIPSIDMFEDLPFNPTEQHQAHIQKQPKSSSLIQVAFLNLVKTINFTL